MIPEVLPRTVARRSMLDHRCHGNDVRMVRVGDDCWFGDGEPRWDCGDVRQLANGHSPNRDDAVIGGRDTRSRRGAAACRDNCQDKRASE